LRCVLKVPGEMTSMVHIYIEDGSPVLRFRILSGAPEWMDSLSGAPEWIDSQCRMSATPINNTLYGCKNSRFAKANAHRIQRDAPE